MKALLFLVLVLASHGVWAEDEGHVRFLKYQADYQVNADATWSVVQDLSYRLFTEVALVNSGKMSISYNGKLEEAELLEAYTLKRDGRRIDVGSAGVQLQQGQVAAGYGISQADQRTMMLTFPQLEVGDAVSYKYKLTQKVPVFAGQFYASSNYARNLAWDAVDVSIELPSTMPLQFDAVRLEALPVIERDGRTRYRWQARNLAATALETSSVDLFRSTPHLVATTFTDWQQFATAYDLRARPMAAVTPEIAALASTLTAGIGEPRAQAKALYDWVAGNVRYVATWVGSDGWVPHPANAVLASRYGDCKDHVVLLEALLAARGITSTTVLINSDKTSYSLPPVVYPAFNHVITYVPSLNLYLDSTAGPSTPFGILPIADSDKPVIHAALGAAVQRTPTVDPTRFAAIRTTRLTLDEDGNVSGDYSISATGAAAIDLREIRQSIGKRKEREWVRELLDTRGMEGSGAVSFEDHADDDGLTVRIDVRINNYLALAENGTIPLAPLLVGPIAFDHLRAVYQRAARTLPYWCPAWTLEDRYEIRVPPTLKLLVPKGQALTQAGFDYASRYAFSDGRLNAVRRLAITHPALACQPDEFPASRVAVARIERDLRAQVIYQTIDMAAQETGAGNTPQTAASAAIPNKDN
ncbi:hypothetical protein RCH09_000717 [Actimicrobium sp. GrIS 1.19]|uniref:DUF3857 domain-containing transglutaminase family protein n=1 Tax=Actimicrobium sp. GrIS 1.19 TaxID=3071708 RepID=UPI002DFB28FA|nr:hypothetical protein [Actimicrobium sp. GrIS 1.19]